MTLCKLAALGVAATLGGCGAVDPGNTYLPAWIPRAARTTTATSEAPPDVRNILKSNMSAVFLPAAAPTNISFSAPRPEQTGWSTCIRATVNGAFGHSIGQQTYVASIARGAVSLVAHVENIQRCAGEQFEPL
jgi:hypothetical protein